MNVYVSLANTEKQRSEAQKQIRMHWKLELVHWGDPEWEFTGSIKVESG